MTINLVPSRLPTLEPVRSAFKAALTADLATALTAVEAQMEQRGLPAITLPVPKLITLASVRSYAEVKVWPTLTIESGGLRPQEETEQTAMGQLRGTIDVYAWLEGSALLLDSLIDRYGAAIWLVALNNEPLGRTVLAPDSLVILPDQSGGMPNRRSARVSFDVLLRV